MSSFFIIQAQCHSAGLSLGSPGRSAPGQEGVEEPHAPLPPLAHLLPVGLTERPQGPEREQHVQPGVSIIS